jgi:hypothetical protein
MSSEKNGPGESRTHGQRDRKVARADQQEFLLHPSADFLSRPDVSVRSQIILIFFVSSLSPEYHFSVNFCIIEYNTYFPYGEGGANFYVMDVGGLQAYANATTCIQT